MMYRQCKYKMLPVALAIADNVGFVMNRREYDLRFIFICLFLSRP